MKRFFLLLMFLMPLSAARAASEVGESYAAPSFQELYRTMVMLGGVDITKPQVADEYAQLIDCERYQKTFSRDLEWNDVRQQIIARVQEKRDYFRVLYEVTSIFKVGRYNSEGQFFPLSSDTALKSAGSTALLSYEDYQPYCGLKEASPFFPPVINLIFNKPLTVDRIPVPQTMVGRLLARMEETRNSERYLYGRIRFRVVDVRLEDVSRKDRIINVLGEVQAVDFFLDRDRSKFVTSISLMR